MKSTALTIGKGGDWEMFRLSKGKDIADICANTLRAYNREGLPFYKVGKAVFVSKVELAAFIRGRAAIAAARSAAQSKAAK